MRQLECASFESIGLVLGRPGKRCSERFAKLQSSRGRVAASTSRIPEGHDKLFDSEEVIVMVVCIYVCMCIYVGESMIDCK